MSNYLQKGKTISDLLAEGKTVNIKDMDDLVNHLSVSEMLELLNYAMKQER